MLELKTFGGLRLEADGAPCSGAVVRPKTLALLALLAPGSHGMSRDKIVAYLWPETDSTRGRHLLKQACHDLRRHLGQPELFLGRKILQFNPAVIASDVQQFEAALEQNDLDGAVAHYAGPFLDGFFLDGSAEFERWVEGERERLARRAGRALEGLARDAAARGEHETAAEWWRRLAELDSLSAEAVLGRMTALAAAKERAEALKVGREYAHLVQRELGAAPARAVTMLMEQLRAQSDEPVALPALASTGPPTPLLPRETAIRSPAEPSTRPRSDSTRRRVVLATIGMVTMAGLAVVLVATRPRSVTPVIAVDPISDHTGPDSTGLGAAVTEMLVANLARVPRLQVIGTTRLYEIAGQSEREGDPRTRISRAAVRAGATQLVEGALLRHPDGTLRLELQLVELRSGVVRHAYVAEDKDAIALVDRLAAQLAESLAALPRR